MSDSVQPHRRQPSRLPCPWDSPSKITGVDCHFLLQYWKQIDNILCIWRWRRSRESAQTRPGAECGSDYELLIAKFRLKLNKVGKATGPLTWKWKKLSHVQLLASPWTVAHQAPLSMGFSRQECWSGVPLPSLLTSSIFKLFSLYIFLHFKIAQSCPTLCNQWTIQSTEFSRSEYWNG